MIRATVRSLARLPSIFRPITTKATGTLREPALNQTAATAEKKQELNTQRQQTMTLSDNQPISKKMVQLLEAELDQGKSIQSLKAFNAALTSLSKNDFDAKMIPVFGEMAHNLESFNPVFTACILKVQMTLGTSDYARRDEALQSLIQPLGGEYGLCPNNPLLKTHRKLFTEWYTSITGELLSDSKAPAPKASEALFDKMMSDVMTGGGATCKVEQATYALGYNLAVEYLAAYEKQWLLDSFRALDKSFFKAQGKNVEWEFLEIHAEGEPEHAELGHKAVTSFVAAKHQNVLAKAIADHDKDFAAFYDKLTALLK